jgi:hypothetical protein
MTRRRSRKPSVMVNGKQTLFSSYRELKKNIISLIKMSYDNDITVFRERRGEWGEWFEHWSLIDGKPMIIKAGWM